MAFIADSIWNAPIYSAPPPNYHRDDEEERAAGEEGLNLHGHRRHSSVRQDITGTISAVSELCSSLFHHDHGGERGPSQPHLSTSTRDDGDAAHTQQQHQQQQAAGGNILEWQQRYRLPTPSEGYTRLFGGGGGEGDASEAAAADRTPTDLFQMMRTEVAATSSINEMLRRIMQGSSSSSAAATMGTTTTSSTGTASQGQNGGGLANNRPAPVLPPRRGGGHHSIISMGGSAQPAAAATATDSVAAGAGSSSGSSGGGSGSARPSAAVGPNTSALEASARRARAASLAARRAMEMPREVGGQSARWGGGNGADVSSIAGLMAAKQLEAAHDAVVPFAARGAARLSNAEALEAHREEQRTAAAMEQWLDTAAENEPAYAFEMSRVGGSDYWRPGDPPPYGSVRPGPREQGAVTVSSAGPSFDALFSATAEAKFRAQLAREEAHYPSYPRMRAWVTRRMVPLTDGHLLSTDASSMDALMGSRWSRHCLAPAPAPARPLPPAGGGGGLEGMPVAALPLTYPHSRVSRVPAAGGASEDLFASTYASHGGFVGGDVTRVDADVRTDPRTGHMLDAFRSNEALMPWLAAMGPAPFDPHVTSDRSYLPPEANLLVGGGEGEEEGAFEVGPLRGFPVADRLAHSRRARKAAGQPPAPRWLRWDE